MKKLLLAFAIVLMAVPASARIDTRQNGDGTASYIGSKGDTRACLGGAFLRFSVNLAAATTDYQISPISNALVTNAYAVANTSTTGSARLKIYVGSNASPQGTGNGALTPIRFVDRSAGTTSDVYIAVEDGTVGGTVVSISNKNEAGADGMIYNTVAAGESIAVATTTAGTGPVGPSAIVLLAVCPR